MITISLDITSAIIGFVVGYIVVSMLWIWLATHDDDAFHKGWNAGSSYGEMIASKKTEWISCKKELPKEAGKYLTQTDEGMIVGGYSDIGWMFPCHVDEVFAWMKLPKPYKEWRI